MSNRRSGFETLFFDYFIEGVVKAIPIALIGCLLAYPFIERATQPKIIPVDQRK